MLEREVFFLRDLVKIKSFSGQEQAAVNFMVDKMLEFGFDEAWVDEAGNACGMMLFDSKLEDEEYFDLVFVGHIDTYPGVIPVTVDGSKIYGRGVVDAKGCLASMFWAMINLRQDLDKIDVKRASRIFLVACVEEECSTSKGANYLASSGLSLPNGDRVEKWQAVIIGEPSGSQAMTLGYKGSLDISFSLIQDASHAGGEIVRAPNAMMDFYVELKKWLNDNYSKESAFHTPILEVREVLYAEDGLKDEVNLGMVLRTPPGFDNDCIGKWLRKHELASCIQFRENVPPYLGGKTNFLVKWFMNSLRKNGLKPKFKKKTGSSDMGIIGKSRDIPMLAYGPGDSHLDHTPHEHLPIDEYQKSIEVLGDVLANVLVGR